MPDQNLPVGKGFDAPDCRIALATLRSVPAASYIFAKPYKGTPSLLVPGAVLGRTTLLPHPPQLPEMGGAPY